MTAIIYDRGDWAAAHQRRTLQSRGPRKAIRRSIYLRELGDGHWCAAVRVWSFGRWLPPEWLCGKTSYNQARKVAVDHHASTGMPVMLHRLGDDRVRPFHIGPHEPTVGAA